MNNYAQDLSRGLMVKVEQHIRTVVRPKPRWLPGFIWRALLRRLIVVEMTHPTFTTEREP